MRIRPVAPEDVQRVTELRLALFAELGELPPPRRSNPRSGPCVLSVLIIEGLLHVEDTDTLVYALRNTDISGNLDLSNRTVEVAVDIKYCHFLGEVDLSYCKVKQTLDFPHCTFHQEFLAEDENRSHTVFQKDLTCIYERYFSL